MNPYKRRIAAICLAIGSMLTGAGALATETVTFFHNDIAGTPMLATDSAGKLVWKENYHPYGERLNKADASANNQLWFAGKPQDAHTGLSYMGARYYDPVLGRFMGVDPVGFDPENIHSFNRYAYANNNPYKFVDPDGHTPLDAIFLVYDLGKLGAALYSGSGVGAALTDVAMSSIGVVSPLPGVGQALKGARITGNLVNGVKGALRFSVGANSGETTTPEDLIIDPETTPGRETRGRADQHNRPGGRDARDKEFDSMNPQEVQNRGKGTKTGILPDGRRVNVHDSKTDGVPTIEVSNGSRDIKIRYP